jgi:hypothetical protein
VSRMDERLEAMQREIDTARTQQRLLTTRLRQPAAAYRMTASAEPISLGASMISHDASGPRAGMQKPGALSGMAYGGRTAFGPTSPAGAPTDGTPLLTRSSTPREVAARIIWEAHRHGYSRHQAIAILSTAMQESGLNPKAKGPNGLWESIFQQDAGYPGRTDSNIAIYAFFDRLGAKGWSGVTGYLEVDLLTTAGTRRVVGRGGTRAGAQGIPGRDPEPADACNAALRPAHQLNDDHALHRRESKTAIERR